MFKRDALLFPNAPKFLAKRQVAPRFLGKRQKAPRFLGKRQYAPRFLGKRQYAPRFLGKRQYAPRFLGKRQYAPRFLGKRPYAPRFLGKRQRAPRYLGKRQYAPRFLGKRQYAPRFLGKRQYAPRFLGKRSYAPRFLGKRSYAPRFLGKRPYAPRFLGKRQYAPRFLGKRNDDVSDLFYSDNTRQATPRFRGDRYFYRDSLGKRQKGPYVSAEEFIKTYRKSDPYFMGKRGDNVFVDDGVGEDTYGDSVMDFELDDNDDEKSSAPKLLDTRGAAKFLGKKNDDQLTQFNDGFSQGDATDSAEDVDRLDEPSVPTNDFEDVDAPYLSDADDFQPAASLTTNWNDIDLSSSRETINKLLKSLETKGKYSGEQSKTNRSSEGRDFTQNLSLHSSDGQVQR